MHRSRISADGSSRSGGRRPWRGVRECKRVQDLRARGPAQQQLFTPIGAWCGGCPLNPFCGSATTDQVCPPTFDPFAPAGIEALHPGRDDFDEVIRSVGGVGFDDIDAKPVEPIALGPSFPQIRWRRNLCLNGPALPWVGVRLAEVTFRGRVRSSVELCRHSGLPETTRVVLLLFDRDDKLELLADRWQESVAEIAAGSYACVLAPSFSLWEPARRPDNLLSLRRSMVGFASLQEAGANAIPRVGWVEVRDVERLADWVLANQSVHTVALDLMTYKETSFDRAVALLAHFDELTEKRLHYIVNGVLAPTKMVALYLAASIDRMTVTEATVARVPTTPQARSFPARCAELEAACVEAKRRYESLPIEQTVEGFLAALRSQQRASLRGS